MSTQYDTDTVSYRIRPVMECAMPGDIVAVPGIVLEPIARYRLLTKEDVWRVGDEWRHYLNDREWRVITSIDLSTTPLDTWLATIRKAKARRLIQNDTRGNDGRPRWQPLDRSALNVSYPLQVKWPNGSVQIAKERSHLPSQLGLGVLWAPYEEPLPPREKPQAEKDEEAYEAWSKTTRSYSHRISWEAALAYARSAK